MRGSRGRQRGLSSNEDELALTAASGDCRALSALAADFYPRVRSLAAKYSDSMSETDDLTQEGMIAFLDAVRTYRLSAGAVFGTYVSTCVRNRIVSSLRKSLSPANVPLRGHVQLDEADDPEDPQSSEELVISQDEAARLLERISCTLNDREMDVFRMHVSGCSYEETAKTMGITKKSVDNTLQRVRRKIRGKLSF